jgi:general secretion pathway protein G
MKYIKSLLKVFIVIFLVAFLFFLFGPRPFTPHSYINKAKYDLTRPQMGPIESAIDSYKLSTGTLPNKLEDLVTNPVGLVNIWTGPYLKEQQLLDPWGFKYIYEPNSVNPTGYNLISYGRDGKPGGEGYNADQEHFTPDTLSK